MTVQVHVAQRHIDNGLKHAIYCCPIGLAMRERLGVEVSVGWQLVRAFYPDGTAYGLLPDEVRAFTHRFNKGELVGPFEFEVNLMKTAHCYYGCGHMVPVYYRNGVLCFRRHSHDGRPAIRSGCNGSDKPVATTIDIEVKLPTTPVRNRLEPAK